MAAAGGFLKKYLRHCGTSEVPAAYHRWCAYGLLAAAAADRLWVQKGATRIRPNLYIFLLGPSGVGKDGAINVALRLTKDFPAIRTLKARITAAYLIDKLAQKKGLHRAGQDGKMMLVTPELAMAVGRGTMADDVIKLMTDLYSGEDYQPLEEGTRTHGKHLISGHCITWIAGTTKEWMRDSVTQDAVEGGFFGRVACIQADYDLNKRIANPSLPTDYETLVGELRDHLDAVAAAEGEVEFEPRAREVLDEWYLTRPAPDDEREIPVWRRQHDLVIKMATLASLADDPTLRVIFPKHVVLGQKLAVEAVRAHTTISEYVAITKESDHLQRVRDLVKKAGLIQESALARAAVGVGVTHDKLRTIIETLTQARIVRRVPFNGRGFGYAWAGRRSLADEEKAP